MGRGAAHRPVQLLGDRLSRATRAGVLVALLALSVSGSVPRPKAVVTRNGALAVALPADLLRSREVTRQLTSGLTTVFVMTVEAQDDEGTTKGGARIDVRLDLWEEKYLVTLVEATGQQRNLAFSSELELGRWWSENPVVVVPPRRFGPRVDVEVKLKMLPFSSQEQSETQRWLARTLSSSRAPSGEQSPAQSAEILRIIVETSVRRRPLFEHHWSVRAERESGK